MKRLFFLLVLSTCFCISIFAQDGSGDAKLVEADESMYKSTQLVEAKVAYNNGCEQQYNLGDLEKAMEFYAKAIELDSNYVEAWDNLGVCYRRADSITKAIECYEKSIQIFPNGTFAHSNLGLIYLFQEKFDLAIEQYQISVGINPIDAECHYGLANVYLTKIDYDNAIVSALEALRLYELNDSPYIADAEIMLARAYHGIGDEENMKLYLKRAESHSGNQE